MVRVSHMLGALVELGRHYLERSPAGGDVEALVSGCRDLVSVVGEASGTALAGDIVQRYLALDDDARLDVLKRLDREFASDTEEVAAACRSFLATPAQEAYLDLAQAIEAPRQEFLRRLNMAPGGTAAIVGMRGLLLSRREAGSAGLEYDLLHLLSSWFNRGFLQFERVDWRTPAVILEKLIAYEAVHAITGWDDLRRRLASDRRCFAFFHPALPDEPLIFVEVALTRGLASRIRDLIDAPEKTDEKADTAIFYSISNCQSGLAGISFGNFLIKQVVDAIRDELPEIKRFATLSPIPGFRRWLDETLVDELPVTLAEEDVEALDRGGWQRDEPSRQSLRPALMQLCAAYLLEPGCPDPVARFHLGNGARVERINWAADPSPKGVEQSGGMMVNYLYAPQEIVANHEAFARHGAVAASSGVSRLAAGRS